MATDDRAARIAQVLKDLNWIIEWVHDAGVTACHYPGNDAACDRDDHWHTDRRCVGLAVESVVGTLLDQLENKTMPRIGEQMAGEMTPSEELAAHQMQASQARVEPPTPCVETAGSTAEKQPGAVTAAERTEQTAWLVALGSMPPTWWTGRGDEWTPDVGGTKLHPAQCAIRFARREDAERAIGWLIEKTLARGCKAEEHIWL